MSNGESKQTISIGIDLGTTNSCVYYLDSLTGNPCIIRDIHTSRLISSCVYKDVNKNIIIVGNKAKERAFIDPENAIFSFKKYMGTSTYLTWGNKKVDSSYKGEKFTPEELSSLVLSHIKEAIEKTHSSDKTLINGIVVTVPAAADDLFRNATITSSVIAFSTSSKTINRDNVNILNEPSAAALSYAYSWKSSNDKLIIVLDFGGGTCDVSVLKHSSQDMNGKIFSNFIVKYTDGNNELGGDDIDKALSKIIALKIQRQYHVNIEDKNIFPDGSGRLLMASKKAKEELSGLNSSEPHSSVNINIPFLRPKSGLNMDHLDIDVTVSLNEFNNNHEIKSVIEKVINLVKNAINNIKNNMENAPFEILFVGGSTNIPIIEERIRKETGIKPNKDVNPDEIVAAGASIFSSSLYDKEKKGSIVLSDVISLNLGLETADGKLQVLLGQNTPLPTKIKDIFVNAVANQTSVSLEIYQGQRPLAKDNKKIGQFSIDITPAPKHQSKIEVEFSAESNGIINVSARDMASNSPSKSITINSGKMSEEEIQDAIKKAEENKESDKKIIENIDTLNQSEEITYTLEEKVKIYEEKEIDKTHSEDFNRLKDIVKEFQDLILDKNYSLLKEKNKSLSEESFKIVGKLDEVLNLKKKDEEKSKTPSDNVNDPDSKNTEDSNSSSTEEEKK